MMQLKYRVGKPVKFTLGGWGGERLSSSVNRLLHHQDVQMARRKKNRKRKDFLGSSASAPGCRLVVTVVSSCYV